MRIMASHLFDDGGVTALPIADWPKGRHRMVSLVETMMTADSLQLAAYRPDEDEIRIVEGGNK
jgi:hypothetical protein